MPSASPPPDQTSARLSRPLRLAARLSGRDENALASELLGAHVFLRIDDACADSPDARLTFLTLVNQILRFCPNLLVQTPDTALDEAAEAIAAALHGPDHRLRTAADRPGPEPTVILVVGTRGAHGGAVVVQSSGWVARVAAGLREPDVLPCPPVEPNAIGAVAAACLGSGATFLRLVAHQMPPPHEVSMFSGEFSPLGTLDLGPPLPSRLPDLDALLAGCGNVGNGWAAIIRELPLGGRLSALDRQALGDENLGPYVLASASDVGTDKVDVIARAVAPSISTRTYPEELDLFVPRITRWRSTPLPPIVVSGFDEAEPRHVLQRLWPTTLIDMAAGGTTAQAHVHRVGEGGQCLLGAHTVPPSSLRYPERVAAATGLRPERITDDYNQPVTDDDVAAAPDEHKAHLDAAQKAGKLICGVITGAALAERSGGDDFAASAPFVGGLAGAMGASLTVRQLLSLPQNSGWHWQYSFLSGRSRGVVMRCEAGCECRQQALTLRGAS